MVRHVFGDGGAGADDAARAHVYRGHQGGVAADKRAFANNGAVFFMAIVIAGDGAGADVHIFANVGIAQVAEVPGLGAAA